MTTGPNTARRASPLRQLAGWELWRLRPDLLVTVLLIECGALASMLVALRGGSTGSWVLSRFFTLLALAICFTEAVHRSDRIHRYLVGTRPYADAQSVWCASAIVALPRGWAALFVAAVFCHSAMRSRPKSSVKKPHRLILSGGTAVLAALAASTAYRGIPGLLDNLPHGPVELVAVIAAIAVFSVVNLALICLTVCVATHTTNWRSIEVSHDDLIFEFVTLTFGVFTGIVLIHDPWLTPAALFILAVLYRATMVTRLQTESNTDQKTGLLNFTAWRENTVRALTRTARLRQPVALMLIDLDHFKRVNDTYGHMVGDEVLIAIADCLRSDLRGYDAVGRFGGEEFVAFLDNADLYAAVAAANRLRTRIGETVVGDGVQVTVSIGIAHAPKSAASLESLLERADAALYEAKEGGRDQVRAVTTFPEMSQESVA